MSFLKLNNIGKIYVNEGNVTVGIRGVDLEFDKGEFVAVTGESGSGKSTLLNVISGIDTYEEGELFIDGEPTSHYIQSDFEEYRKKYISFIFQDYNIIDSYTVLENVELALMHIDNKKQRKKKALELIERVGLTPWLKHKGSKLSGGQKQRTVIARALAKDSPIILADEPTGNLDAATSREIIELLKEVSVGKLLIVVTHNFDEVKEYATRHIRVYNNKVISDRIITENKIINQESDIKNTEVNYKNNKIKNYISTLKNGLLLGSSIFKSTPILSSFTVFLFFICTIGLIIVTSFFNYAFNFSTEYNMFNEVEGRIIFIPREDRLFSTQELEEIKLKYDADEILRHDAILDHKVSVNYNKIGYTFDFTFEYYNNSVEPDFGRKPQNIDEIMLYAPIGLKLVYGEDLSEKTILLNNINYKVVGIKYFYDNTQNGKIYTSKEGFEFLSYLFYFDFSNAEINVRTGNQYVTSSISYKNLTVDFSLEGEAIKIPVSEITNNYDDFFTFMQLSVNNSLNNGGYYNPIFINETISKDKIIISDDDEQKIPSISADYLKAIIKENALKDYRQSSLFLKDKKQIDEVIDSMNTVGYIALASDTKYTPDVFTVITNSVIVFFNGLLWLAIVLFLSFFISLCLSRSVGSFKTDIPIMRSMGISVNVIEIGIYTKIFISQLIAFIPALVFSFIIFTIPKYNLLFTYLKPIHYSLILVGVIIISVRIVQKQIKKLFGISVKTALKGGKD